ncbi:MAG: cytochrome c3 family protein [Thiohalocapsa sp.]
MAIFGPRANLFMNVALAAAAVLVAVLLLAIWVVPVSGYNTQKRYRPQQPVPFSHQHHVSGLGLDCRYCHTAVEVSSNAGMPPTETCMTCHSQIWTNAALLAPVRQSLAEKKPLRWTRVYTLPDYVYFDHSIHVAKGVGCTECHGPIGDMSLTWKASTLEMRWCLSCHRDPAPHLRPKDQVFNPHWHRTSDTPSGKQLMAEYHIHPETLTDCGVCHR